MSGGSATMTTECRLDENEYFLCYSGAPVTFSSLDQGDHDFFVKVTDAAGNSNDLRLWSWRVDVPPECHVAVAKAAGRRGPRHL